MHDRIKGASVEYSFEGSAIREVADYEFGVFRYRLTVSPAEIIENDNIVARV
jgi:hypothetical protein